MAISQTFETFAQKVASNKSVLAHLEPAQRLVLWELDAGAVYKRSVDHYVINVFKETTALTQGSSSSLNAGEFYFDYSDKTLYVRLGDDSNPEESFMVGVYRLFFSNQGHVLSWDLTDDGNEVYYEALLSETSNFKQELDNAELLGISLESDGSIRFDNSNGYWDSIFDRLIWDSRRIAIYSWFPDTPFSESKLIFEGEFEDKTFTQNSVTFSIKDFIYRLRQPVGLDLFSESDGTLSEDIKGVKYKRRIYGEVTGAQTQSLDQTLAGFQLSGTISGSKDAFTVSGSGTSFLSECSPGDEIIVDVPIFGEFTYKIESIETDTSLTLSEEIERGFSAITTINNPEIPVRTKNRPQHISGHKLREPTTTITAVIQLNRFRMDPTDFFANDIIVVGSETVRIKRISDDLIILFQNLDSLPSIGTTVKKNPINAVYFDQRELIIDRDYTIQNSASECKITLDDLAEFNITKAIKIAGSFTFTNGSRNVTATGAAFEANLKPRDWIRSDDPFHATWYEVLQVNSDGDLDVRIAYAGANFGGTAKRKNINYVGDESIVTVDCIGKEDSAGKWVKTASDVVLDLVQGDAALTNIDTDSFDTSKIEADYIVSLKLPLSPTGEPPIIRDVISLMNQSVFGSLVARTDFQVSFNVLTPDRPDDLEELKDEDLIGARQNFSVSTKSDVRRKIIGRYNHFDADRYTGKKGNDSTDFENSFVDYLIGTKNEKTVDIYLLNETDAETITERYALIHSLTQNVVTVKAKLNLTLRNLNEKIFIGLTRMFDRFGGSSENKKIGIISKISRGATETTVTFSDLSNQFNRVGAIADDSALDFTSAPESEKIFNGYIVDDDTELPDEAATSDDQWNTNLIG